MGGEFSWGFLALLVVFLVLLLAIVKKWGGRVEVGVIYLVGFVLSFVPFWFMRLWSRYNPLVAFFSYIFAVFFLILFLLEFLDFFIDDEDEGKEK